MSSTKTKRKLVPLLILLALRPLDAAADVRLSLTGGPSVVCEGVKGDGPCERFARGELTLDLAHFKRRTFESFEKGTTEARDSVVDFGQDTVQNSPIYGARAGFQDIRTIAFIPFLILIIAMFGLFVIAFSYLTAAVFLGMALMVGTESTVGLYAIEEGSRAEGSSSVLRHYGVQASLYPVIGAPFKFGIAAGYLQETLTGRNGHSFRVNMGVAPIPGESGPVILAEVERLRLPEHEELAKTENRQVAMTAGFALSF